MPNVSIDIKQLSGVDPGVDASKASFDFWPYEPVHVVKDDENYLLNKNIRRVKTVDGVAAPVLPTTPTGNAMWVQGRSYKGADKWLVAIPATDCNLWDLPHLDPETLDPETPLSPAWVADLAAVQDELADKADTTALTTGLATKVNSSTYTAGMAAKTDLTSAGRDALTLTDFPKLQSTIVRWAQRGSRLFNVGILGASIAEGFLASSHANTVAQMLAKNLRSVGGISGGGRGFIGIPSPIMRSNGVTWPIAFSGGSFDDTTFNWGAKHTAWFVPSGASTATLTVPAAGVTSTEIHYIKATGSTLNGNSYKIGAAAAVPFGNVAAVDTNSVQTTGAIPGGTNLVLSRISGASIYTGIREYNGDETSGAQVHNLGHSSWSASQWASGGSSAAWAKEIAALNLDVLVMMDFPINDGNTGVGGGNKSATAAKADLIALIAILRAAGVSSPILLVADHNPSAVVTMVSPWADYVTALREVSAADSTVAFLDMTSRAPVSSPANPLGIFATDGLHSAPNGGLSQMYADAIATAILPR